MNREGGGNIIMNVDGSNYLSVTKIKYNNNNNNKYIL